MLNKQNGHMYKFVTHTWNAIKGKCPHDCSYCYMKKWQVKELRLDEKELKTNLGENNFIFVGSGTDMFADSVPDDWISKTLGHCNAYNNRYLIQSKNPSRMLQYIDYPVFKKSVCCTTIESNRFYPQIMNNSPKIEDRVRAMASIASKGYPVFITCEPIMDFDLPIMLDYIRACSPLLVTVGKKSRWDIGLHEPNDEKLANLKTELMKFTKVLLK